MLLDKKWETSFHYTVVRLIFVMSRYRKDIKMDIIFLCIQLRRPNEDDLGNLVRFLIYIRCTLYMLLILRADILSVIKWWDNASFAAHPYCKVHTG